MALRFPLARPRTALLAGLIAAASVVGAARVQAQQPRPFGTLTVPADSLAPRPFAKFSADAESMRDSIVALARAQLGKRYVLGGTNPRRGFDCSGLVKYVLGMLDISLPRTARQQAKMG
jgi:cell wall-associated NlpC family hydrolase